MVNSEQWILKILCIQIAIVSPAYRGEFQNARVRISYSALVKHSIAFSPDHIFCLLICQYFHFAFQHNSGISDQPFMTKVNAGIGIIQILFDAHWRSVSWKIKLAQSVGFSRSQHCFHVWKSLVVNRTDKSSFLLLDKFWYAIYGWCRNWCLWTS